MSDYCSFLNIGALVLFVTNHYLVTNAMSFESNISCIAYAISNKSQINLNED